MSREAVIDTIEWYRTNPHWFTEDHIIEDIKGLSSVQSRPYGEWLDTETSYADDGKQYCKCSVCGKQSLRPLGDFCRWCGADMRGGEQDPERAKGEWIESEFDESVYCSECNAEFESKYRFCPHCGADMRGGE